MAAASLPGDDALTCQAIGAAIEQMNKRVTQANQRTQQIAGVSATGNATDANSDVTQALPGQSGQFYGSSLNQPMIASRSGGAHNGHDADLQNQQNLATAAIARANRLILLGRAKRCFA